MTEVPQATAREEAVEVMARALSPIGRIDNPDGEYRRELARIALDALLAATQEETCPECSGTGDIWVDRWKGHPCEHCDGSGRLRGAPLVLLGPEPAGLFVVGERGSEHYAPLFRAPFIEAQREEA